MYMAIQLVFNKMQNYFAFHPKCLHHLLNQMLDVFALSTSKLWYTHGVQFYTYLNSACAPFIPYSCKSTPSTSVWKNMMSWPSFSMFTVLLHPTVYGRTHTLYTVHALHACTLYIFIIFAFISFSQLTNMYRLFHLKWKFLANATIVCHISLFHYTTLCVHEMKWHCYNCLTPISIANFQPKSLEKH